MATSLNSTKYEEIKMNNETAREISNIHQALGRQVDRITAIDDRVKKLELAALDKDRLIELLSDENKRLKSKIKHLETEIRCPYCNKVFDMWIEEA
jgi:predicted nuclease with TOPRIM domain